MSDPEKPEKLNRDPNQLRGIHLASYECHVLKSWLADALLLGLESGGKPLKPLHDFGVLVCKIMLLGRIGLQMWSRANEEKHSEMRKR